MKNIKNELASVYKISWYKLSVAYNYKILLKKELESVISDEYIRLKANSNREELPGKISASRNLKVGHRLLSELKDELKVLVNQIKLEKKSYLKYCK